MFGQKMQDMPLLGVPITVKDSIAVKRMLFTGGLYSRRTNFATEDATVIKNIRKAGAIPIANSNVGELSMSTDTDNNFIGFTNNPYDLSRTPGAGGGGESALIASGCSVVGVGADIAASLRWPAFCCGIFGHKVTSGILPVQGIFPEISEAISHLFTIGPFCRYACDIIPMIKAMAGEDIKYLPNIDLPVDLSKIKLYYMFTDEDPFKPALSEEIKSALLNVVNHFKTKYKIECSQVNFEEFSIAADLWTQAFTQGHDFHEEMSNGTEKLSICVEMLKSAFGLSKHTKRSLLFAYFARNDPNFDQSKVTTFELLQKKFEETLRTDGVFLYPPMSTVAQTRILTYLDSCNIGYTCIFNLLNAPVTQCPLGLNADGIPLGIQVAANAYNDHLTIAVAKEIEAAFHGWVPPCCLRTDIDSLNESITQ
ncbi:fatty-acid amide hydrolase 2-like isoform X1 [Leptotrombidium deliense]|uniref:Fatty-acid amide hydrolase 2-like isoform X1 n=1 Tax=Leptotrombidium deliense TaxID=299467 RepID=A0A443S3T5_9ACAR|nr:fatty-acid amide hydrolase 2-like isoform X1 [Leptotrombidium deliense]